VRLVRGNLPSARSACEPFAAQAPEVAQLCRLQVDVLTGEVERSWPRLRALARSDAPALAGWAAALLGESLLRVGPRDEAVRSLARAAAISGSLYDSLALADAYLAGGRPSEALRTLAALPSTDAVLLRRFRALESSRSEERDEVRARLEERFAAASPEEAALHARERALFALWAGADAEQARRWAVENLALQKEPIDLRIAAEAALRAGDATLRAELRDFVGRSGLRDRRLEAALQDGAASGPNARTLTP
jgi:hypothetical protein